MGDMLRKAYGDEYPNYYINPFGEREIRVGTIIEYEDDFPTAAEMRARKDSLTVADEVTLNEIKKLLGNANDCTSITYEGRLSSAVTKFLCEKGYKIDRDRQYNIEYTTISWRE